MLLGLQVTVSVGGGGGPVLESLSKGVATRPLDCFSIRGCADPVLAREEELLPRHHH